MERQREVWTKSQRAFQKPAILGEIYSLTNDHLVTNLEDPGQVNKL